MANPNQSTSSTLIGEMFRMTPAYIFVTALREALKSRRRASIGAGIQPAVAR